MHPVRLPDFLLTNPVKLPILSGMTGIEKLLCIARAFAELNGIELSTVSWRVFGDTKKLAAMENGADIQTRRYERAIQWFSDNWPEGSDWPDGITRPSPRRDPPPPPQEASAA